MEEKDQPDYIRIYRRSSKADFLHEQFNFDDETEMTATWFRIRMRHPSGGVFDLSIPKHIIRDALGLG